MTTKNNLTSEIIGKSYFLLNAVLQFDSVLDLWQFL